MTELPYFDQILEGLRRGEEPSQVFDRYVHWGYWENPARATRDPEEFRTAMERLNHQVVGAADLHDGHAVLDAGCGFGGTLAALGARWKDLHRVGINIDPRQIEIARVRVPGATFVEGDACALPFAAASFDRVLAVESIFHFPSRLRFLQEASRVLTPGGRLALSDFVPRRLSEARSWLGRAIERRIARGYGSFGERWTDGNYEKMAASAGLRVIVDRDITRQTLPTYPVVLALLRRRRAAGAARDCMFGSTLLLQWVSKFGLVRYRIVAFEKVDSTVDAAASKNSPSHAAP